ncbi:MAG: UTP--glucose-1-phosphate uridylyltransferase [Neomegalonema sp.]|nr:UTP--glucose-1-phosphate uridylyltransferase [Neomegalonema sp.]
MTAVKTAVFPVAGMGTRTLPATKAIPKELLTIVDKPVLQLAVEEARAGGIERFVFVTSGIKTAIATHFRRDIALEKKLEAKNKMDILDAVKGAAIPEGDLLFVEQHEALGLGHAVWCARHAVGNQPFAVLLPDDAIQGESSIKEMLAHHTDPKQQSIAVMEVPLEDTKKYGVLDVETDDGKVATAKGMVEKPDPSVAPSRLAVVGRYILPPEIFHPLNEKKLGAGNEIQLTDAIDAIKGECPIRGIRFSGRRFDCGSKKGFVEANVAYGMADPEVRPVIENLLKTLG